LVAVTVWDEPPRKTVKAKSFVLPTLVRRILSLAAPLPKSKYFAQLAVEDVYAHTLALKPEVKLFKPVLGRMT
jgi:hypothetical protein